MSFLTAASERSSSGLSGAASASSPARAPPLSVLSALGTDLILPAITLSPPGAEPAPDHNPSMSSLVDVFTGRRLRWPKGAAHARSGLCDGRPTCKRLPCPADPHRAGPPSPARVVGRLALHLLCPPPVRPPANGTGTEAHRYRHDPRKESRRLGLPAGRHRWEMPPAGPVWSPFSPNPA